MPEFILDMGAPAASAVFGSLDSFTQGYITAAFFTSTGPDNEDEGLGEASFAELAPAALDAIVKDCAAWQEANADELQSAYETETGYDETRAGHDYWYTRNGHGTGFWDRGLGEAGEALANACRYHAVDLYRGDDGLIYFS